MADATSVPNDVPTGVQQPTGFIPKWNWFIIVLVTLIGILGVIIGGMYGVREYFGKSIMKDYVNQRYSDA